MDNVEILNSRILADAFPHFTYKDDNILFYGNLKDLPMTDSNLRTDMYVCIFCSAGKLSCSINGENVTLSRMRSFICPPNHVVADIMMSPDFECAVICMTEGIVQASLADKMDIWTHALFVDRCYTFDINEDMSQYLKQFYEIVHFQITHSNPFASEVMLCLTKALLLSYCGLLTVTGQAPQDGKTSESNRLFDRFLHLLQQEEQRRHPVDYYAQKLCVTPKYLSMVCKRQSGKTALEWIHQYVTEDVRFYLTESALSIKEISNRLGFPNISFFGKYTRDKLGASPREYRARKVKRE